MPCVTRKQIDDSQDLPREQSRRFPSGGPMGRTYGSGP